MSYLIINDGLDYKIAKLLTSYKNHDLVEIIDGTQNSSIHKKIKPEQQILQLSTNDIVKFRQHVEALMTTIDNEILWQLIDNPYDKHSISELAALYFNDNYSEIEASALLFNLQNNNLTIKNHLNGQFSLYTPEEQEKQQEILNRKKLEQAEFDQYYIALLNNQKPNFHDVDLIRLLNRPDKNSIPYKVLQQRSKELNLTQLELCHSIGLIENLPEFFRQSFMRENFPHGMNYLNMTSNHPSNNLTTNLIKNPNLKVFSIDDSTTTEIDDAFSIQHIANGFIIGVHIAAPALDSTLAGIVAENISTIYYPGHKITMLPDSVVKQYSLDEGKTTPVVSIYFTINNELEIIDYNSKTEVINISANLRIEALEKMFNVDNLLTIQGYPYETELKLLHQFAHKLEAKRGKPSVNALVLDYNFSFAEDGKIKIKPRLRGNPIDKLVSELMILANGTWGRMLTNAFIPAIYRVKQPNFPVKMTTAPASHTGLNVDYYTWATSPLRRSVDYINQKQIISLVNQDKKHYSALDPTLLEVVENFDNKYGKYLEFQNQMERYWSLAYLIQEQITEIDATFTYKSKVQLSGIPLSVDTQGVIAAKPQGSIIKLKIYNINLAKLTFDYKIHETL